MKKIKRAIMAFEASIASICISHTDIQIEEIEKPATHIRAAGKKVILIHTATTRKDLVAEF